MRIALPEPVHPETARPRSIHIPRERALRLAALAAIVALAAALRFANLSALGYVNHYYAAAVQSMLQSWHNFFFVAAEPGGSVSVDKPPIGLWLQAGSALIFGVNTFGLLLPELLAGIAAVIVLYHLVQRSFGAAAGLLAALALAVTPVVVATDRNNTIDSTLILTLLLAAWAFIKATETARLRYLLLGAFIVGIGFNIKMLEAYLPLPAFYALYFLGAKKPFWRKLGSLALATGLLLAVSLSWALAVDLTPASQRPYVGSSGDNSEISLIVGYNGLERLLGMVRARPGAAGGFNPGSLLQPPSRGSNGSGFQPPAPGGGFGGFPGGNGGFGGGRQFPGSGGGSGRGAFNGAFAGGFGGTGRAGPLRLFTPPLSNEVSWLLPLGIFAGLVLLFGRRITWPLSPGHQALVLWGGWLLTDAVFFSVAGFFHEYYLANMGDPLAALVAIGVIALWRLGTKYPWPAAIALAAATALTLAFQLRTAAVFVRSLPWQPFAWGLAAAGAVILLVAAFRRVRVASAAGYACLLAAVLVTPGIWSGLTVLHPSDNQSLPAAYTGRASGPVGGGGLNVNPALIDYLTPRTQGMKYLMAVPSSMQGADYVLATGRPVLYMGGFMGEDAVVTPESLAQLVSSGQLRYIYWDARGGGFGGFGGQSSVSSWVTQHCTAVTGFDTATQNAGAPDGTNRGSSGFGGFGRGMQITLYDCGQFVQAPVQ
jgi:4-amino-4-deoxy-L-arabinose transferase-like glycosyltransferase